MASRKKRTRFLVDTVQYKLLAVTLIYILIAITLSTFLMFLPSVVQLSMGDASDAQIEAAREILLLHKRFWPAIIAVTALLTIHSLFLFHRIFGPLYRFREIFRQVEKGNLTTPVGIRKNDFLHTEEQGIREMVFSLKTEISLLKKDHAALINELDDLTLVLDTEVQHSEIVQKKLQMMKQQTEIMRKGLDHFKT